MESLAAYAARDSIVIEADGVAPGTLTITSFSKKNAITVGEETFTYRVIKNSAEIPGINVDLTGSFRSIVQKSHLFEKKGDIHMLSISNISINNNNETKGMLQLGQPLTGDLYTF